jgi:hypothetical protein
MIYYIACTATQRLKIGYTRGEPEVRLKQLQTGSAADLRLMACHAGTLDDEKYLHQKFASERLRGEWFEVSEGVLEHLSMVIWLTGIQCSETGEEPPSWVRVGLRAMADGAPPLPEKLAVFL